MSTPTYMEEMLSRTRVDDSSPIFDKAFTAYKAYVAVKLHFEDAGYDFFKYRGKVRSPKEATFKKRADKYKFVSIAKKLAVDEYPYFFAAQVFKEGKLPWIGTINGASGFAAYHDYLRRNANMAYTFETELIKVLPAGVTKGNLKEYLSGEAYPFRPLQDWREGRISVEVLAVLDRLTGFVKKVDGPVALMELGKATDFLKLVIKTSPWISTYHDRDCLDFLERSRSQAEVEEI
jgi:hypothetical protein